MDAPTMQAVAVAILVAVVAASLQVLCRLLSSRSSCSAGDLPLPPGTFDPPLVGHTLSFLRALRANTADEWLRRWAAAYGPVSRLFLFGSPTAFLVGPAANKFLFSSAATTMTPRSHESFVRMVGRRSIREVAGDDHRRVRAMMVRFLRVDAVKRYVARMDSEVRRHLDAEWRGRSTVAVMPSMKSLTFQIMCSVLFGLRNREDAAVRRQLWTEFQQLVRGMWAIPINLPFTTFGRCLAASRRGRRTVAGIIQERRRRAKLEREEDVITHMLAEGLPDDDIIDNVMFLMVAAHDTTAALLTFLIRHLDADDDVCAKVVLEQEEIARSKKDAALTWEDLGRMRYTWAAAQETLRLVPPVFTTLRKTTADVEFAGYLIPKGWQVMQATNMTHWDPAVFPDPSRFDPARFVENTSAAAMIPPFTFVPFGGGARVCPGNEFARVETLVALHYIVTRFRWKLAAGCDGSFSRSPLPYPSQGLLIDIQPISSSEQG